MGFELVTGDPITIVFTGILTEDVVRDKEGIMGTIMTGKIVGRATTTVSSITVIHANALDRAW